MNRLASIKTVALVVAALAVFGCKSKQEGAPKAGPQAQQGQNVKSISGESAAGKIVTSPKDKADAEAAAAKVISQMESGQWPAIYQAAAPGFKQIGPENAFAGKFEQTRKKIGPLQDPKLISFVTRPDQTHVLVYRMHNDKWISDRRLTFARSKEGKMELFGLNQHDEGLKAPIKKN